MRGVFAVDIYRRGEIIEQFVDDNLIVDRGRTNVVQLLGGVSGLNITKIGFGTGGTAASPGNTALTDSYIKAIDGVSYPDSFSVRFAFTLGANEANGKNILEFGLFTADNHLHARKVRSGAIVKDEDLTLSGSWTLMY